LFFFSTWTLSINAVSITYQTIDAETVTSWMVRRSWRRRGRRRWRGRGKQIYQAFQIAPNHCWLVGLICKQRGNWHERSVNGSFQWGGPLSENAGEKRNLDITILFNLLLCMEAVRTQCC
jgi:hypothetical protein